MQLRAILPDDMTITPNFDPPPNHEEIVNGIKEMLTIMNTCKREEYKKRKMYNRVLSALHGLRPELFQEALPPPPEPEELMPVTTAAPASSTTTPTTTTAQPSDDTNGWLSWRPWRRSQTTTTTTETEAPQDTMTPETPAENATREPPSTLPTTLTGRLLGGVTWGLSFVIPTDDPEDYYLLLPDPATSSKEKKEEKKPEPKDPKDKDQ